MDDYHFKMIKSLLAHDLRLTRKMQEEYDRIKIADLMEERFRGADCVDKLIELVKGIDDIKHLVKTLQKEKLKVLRRLNAKETASAKKESRMNPVLMNRHPPQMKLRDLNQPRIHL